MCIIGSVNISYPSNLYSLISTLKIQTRFSDKTKTQILRTETALGKGNKRISRKRGGCTCTLDWNLSCHHILLFAEMRITKSSKRKGIIQYSALVTKNQGYIYAWNHRTLGYKYQLLLIDAQSSFRQYSTLHGVRSKPPLIFFFSFFFDNHDSAFSLYIDR